MKALKILAIVVLIGGVALALIFPRTTYTAEVARTEEEIEAIEEQRETAQQMPAMPNMPAPPGGGPEGEIPEFKVVDINTWQPFWADIEGKRIIWTSWTSPEEKSESGTSWFAATRGTIFWVWVAIIASLLIYVIADVLEKRGQKPAEETAGAGEETPSQSAQEEQESDQV